MHIEKFVQGFYIVHRTCITKEWKNEGENEGIITSRDPARV
jgi:hypothetical protein